MPGTTAKYKTNPGNSKTSRHKNNNLGLWSLGNTQKKHISNNKMQGTILCLLTVNSVFVFDSVIFTGYDFLQLRYN